MPRLLSLNLGVIRTVVHKGEEVPTGIFKSSVAGPAHLGLEGFEGDQVADRRNHGGLEKATYLYPWEHYAYWRERLGRDDLEPGQFGENLTTVGLDERSVLIGERFQIGEAVIEACQARIPCFKLELRMERPGMVEEFLKAERPGIYFRVLHPGRVATNDAIESIHRPDGAATVWEANHTLHFDRVNLRAVRRVLASDGLASGWRQRFQSFLPGPARFAWMPSPIGPLTVAVDTRGRLTHVLFGEVVKPGWVRDEPAVGHVRKQLDEYFAGERKAFNLEVAPAGTAFQHEVWSALQRIPYGQTRSYGDVAEQLGRPEAARAVGRANGSNPVAIVVPCHRVIGRDGSMTGFGGGTDVKARLLALEQGQLHSLFD